MKKIYSLFAVLFVTAGLMAQIGPSWWQYLPEDYATNPVARDTLTILKVADDVVDNAASLSDLWTSVLSEKTAIASVTNGACNIANAADMSAEGMAFFDGTNFYVLFNVNDDEVMTEGNDRIEMHLAPYANKYDPGRPIYLDQTSWMFKDSSDGNGYYMFGGLGLSEAVYTDMALYGSWTEAGAYKSEWLLTSGEGLYPGACTYTLKGPLQDTLNDVTMGAVDVACMSLYEEKTGGYFFLTITPLTIWAPKVPGAVDFPLMSIAIKVNDADTDNGDCTDPPDATVDRSEAWGPGAIDNSAYWAIGFYGGVGKFALGGTGIREINPATQSKVYYYSDYLRFTRNDVVSSVDVYNIAGQLVKSIKSPSEMVSLSGLQKGVYIVRATEFSGAVSVVKIVR